MNKSESKYFATAARMDDAFLTILAKKDFKCKSQYKNVGLGQYKNVGFPTFLYCLFSLHLL